MVKNKFDKIQAFPAGFGGWNFSLNEKNTLQRKENSSRQQQKQCREFLEWVNHHIDGIKVLNLQEDFRDGMVFAQLIQTISGMQVEGVDVKKDPLSNISNVLHFLQQQNVCMHPLSVYDIVAGDVRATMRLVLAVAAHYHPSHIVPRKDGDKAEGNESVIYNKRNGLQTSAKQEKNSPSISSRDNNKNPSNCNDDNGNNIDKRNNKIINSNIESTRCINSSNTINTNDAVDDNHGSLEKNHKGILEELAELKANTGTLMHLLSDTSNITKETNVIGCNEENEPLKIVLNLDSTSTLAHSLKSHGLCLKSIRELLARVSGKLYVPERDGDHFTNKQLLNEDEIVKFDGKTMNVWVKNLES